MGRHLYAKAEALIELLEIHDCGSVGGFDTEAGGDSMFGFLYFEQRFEVLKRKYSPEADDQEYCGEELEGHKKGKKKR